MAFKKLTKKQKVLGGLGCFLIFVVITLGASGVAGYFYWTTILKPQSLKAGLSEQINTLKTYEFETHIEVSEKTQETEDPEKYHFKSKGKIDYKNQHASIEEKLGSEGEKEGTTDYEVKINKRDYFVWNSDKEWYVKDQFVGGMWKRRSMRYDSYFNSLWDAWVGFQDQEDKYTYVGIEDLNGTEVYKWTVEGDIWVQKLLEVELDKYVGQEGARVEDAVLNFLIFPNGKPAGQVLEVEYRVSPDDGEISGSFIETTKYSSYDESIKVEVDEEQILAQMSPEYVLDNVYSEIKNVSSFNLARKVDYSNDYTYTYTSGPYNYSGGDKSIYKITEDNKVDLDDKKAKVSIEWDHNLGAYSSGYYGSSMKESGKGVIYANDYTYWAKYNKSKDFKESDYGFFDYYVDYPLYNSYGSSYYVSYFSYLLKPFKELDDVAPSKIKYLKREKLNDKNTFVFEVKDSEIIKALNNDATLIAKDGLKYESSSGYSSQTVDINKNYWRIWIERESQLPLKIERYYKFNWQGNSDYGVSKETVSRKDVYTFTDYNSDISIKFPEGVGEYDSNGEVKGT